MLLYNARQKQNDVPVWQYVDLLFDVTEIYMEPTKILAVAKTLHFYCPPISQKLQHI